MRLPSGSSCSFPPRNCARPERHAIRRLAKIDQIAACSFHLPSLQRKIRRARSDFRSFPLSKTVCAGAAMQLPTVKPLNNALELEWFRPSLSAFASQPQLERKLPLTTTRRHGHLAMTPVGHIRVSTSADLLIAFCGGVRSLRPVQTGPFFMRSHPTRSYLGRSRASGAGDRFNARALWRRQARYGGHWHELQRRILAWQSLHRIGSPTHRSRPRLRDETGSMLALNEASRRSAGARQDHRPYMRSYIGRCRPYRRKADARDELGGEDSLHLPFLLATSSSNSVNHKTGTARSGSAKTCKPPKYWPGEPRIGKARSRRLPLPCGVRRELRSAF